MDALKNYLMEYVVYGKDGHVIKKGKIKAKQKRNVFEAKAGFGKHIEKKYGDTLGRLEIKSCKDENILDSLFGNKFSENQPYSSFNDIFKNKL